MTTTLIPSFDDSTVTAVTKAVGDLYSGTEITRLLAAAKLPRRGLMETCDPTSVPGANEVLGGH